MPYISITPSPCTLLLLTLAFVCTTLAQAQPQIGTRTFVAAPQALAMGGAGVASPSARTALFYNPAQLTHLKYDRSPVTMFGGSLSISSNFRQQHSYLKNHIQPALAEGLDQLSEDQRQALYTEILQHQQDPALLSGEVLLPSFVLNRGDYGFGGGLFAHTEWTYNIKDTPTGVPEVDFTALADIMAVASGSVNLDRLGLKGLSTGATAKYVQRYLSLKDKNLEAVDYAQETFYVLGASAAVVDLGVLYEVGFLPGPGRFFLGATWSDLALTDFNYSFSLYWENLEDTKNEAAIAEEAALAQARYQVHPTFRGGLAFVHPGPGGLLGETTVALDYVKHEYEETASLPSHLSLGLQTQLGSAFSVRTGLHEGYSTFGAGFSVRPVRIDYAYYTNKQDVVLSQSGGSHHRIEISLGL